jgi:hypothetical protein
MIGSWYRYAVETAEKVLSDPSLKSDDRDCLRQAVWLLAQAQLCEQTDPASAAEMRIEGGLRIGAIAFHADSSWAFIRGPKVSGFLSGKARRAKAEEKLRHAFDLAIAIRAENQSIKQFDLEGEILSRWNSKLRRPKQLTKAISRWEREGKLAPRRNK